MVGKARRTAHWWDHVPALRRDVVLVGMVLWTALAGLLFFVLAGHTEWQLRAFWGAQPLLDAVLAISSWNVAKITTGALRRFWLLLAGVGTTFTIGDTYQTVLTFVRPEGLSTNGGIVQSVCLALGLGAVIVAMLIHPHPQRSGRERVAFWLDSATVLVGGAVVAWCFAVTPGLSTGEDVFGTLAAAAVSITSAFAAVKMALSGNAPMHKLAAVPMIMAASVTSVGFFLAPAGGTELPAFVYFVRFVPSLLISMGPRIQEIVARFDRTAFGDRRRKPYSLLPYGSIALAFGSLIVVLPEGVNLRVWGVVAGMGTICAMVASRQLVAFHDNKRLINQLDTTLAELREHEVRLRHQALFDGLTGLANRTHFHEQVTTELDAAARTPSASMLLIDLDGFKKVNDTMGHAAGDALLVAVAHRLRDTVRSTDLVARLGGDEFAILLRDCTVDEAEQMSRRILRALAPPVPIEGTAVAVGASIGAAGAVHGDDVESLLRHADLAMYAAKSEGKGTCRRYHADLEARDLRNVA